MVATQIFVDFHPEPWGRRTQLDGLVQPLTSFFVFFSLGGRVAQKNCEFLDVASSRWLDKRSSFKLLGITYLGGKDQLKLLFNFGWQRVFNSEIGKMFNFGSKIVNQKLLYLVGWVITRKWQVFLQYSWTQSFQYAVSLNPQIAWKFNEWISWICLKWYCYCLPW